MAPLNAYAQVIFYAPGPRSRRPVPASAAGTRRPMPKTRYPPRPPDQDFKHELRQTNKLGARVEKHGSIYDRPRKGSVKSGLRTPSAGNRETPAEPSQSWGEAHPDASPDACASRR